MGKLDGKVAFITGAARGMGRAAAVRLAEDGADIVAVDICGQIASVPYPLATVDDLKETERLVEALGRRIVARAADVRDREGLQAAFDEGRAELGPVGIVIANAGIAPMAVEEHPAAWQDSLDVNLTGVFHTVDVAVPSMVEAGHGGSIALVSSTGGLVGVNGPDPGGLSYGAAKHAVVGLMRSYANFLARHSIRVNTVNPTGTRTTMAVNDAMAAFFARSASFSGEKARALPVDMIEPEDVANALAWLVSDDARYVTGVALPVDAGFVNKK
ncbi:mycofactocin-coupled SDR family oxidoreductase [Pseudonocardia ailaonensis]|uniref:Mycofactocin-coupled SDR family oxidoreductase n=1 Tax=Pseudonocardia ailaonensis TaxID=367279 RepID=A0ABN2N4F0_9PSEU